MAESGRRRHLEERVVDLILEQGLPAGAPLPSEPALVDTLGVSRNSVREALRALHTLGIVDIRHGYGTFVGSAPLTAVTPGLLFRTRLRVRDDPGALADLVEVRELLELGLIEHVATSVDEAQLETLDRAVEAMAEGDLAAADRRFHEALYAPVANELAIQLISVFWDIYHQVAGELERTPVDRDRVVQGHRRVVEALRSGDPAQARQALLNHFADLRDRVRRLVTAVSESR
ncbi:DNA-binding transcriptional regulator, FadR family [Actinopolymorpha cephalotaxi]|uniref:DNA-binding FadR family transcriptional regulator n=1 Tax=Actinopolymorpha cephalotaxi TaxID=504797 RepID=A0A1I2TEN2_9ACTN|nr:FadR/GntR family transcriptional regulator [Actinopolymorpha cephalotaxi]NYH83052.1 DNA-binding FadR family transcriptional regulator [Actinopolymorpha cephalotaxi]SFG63298.1 DNA-binding transcriptional regulator, FadR family [Actinopolymorpha cephalotaxi]